MTAAGREFHMMDGDLARAGVQMRGVSAGPSIPQGERPEEIRRDGHSAVE